MASGSVCVCGVQSCSDTVTLSVASENQLRRLAQIRAVLGCRQEETFFTADGQKVSRVHTGRLRCGLFWFTDTQTPGWLAWADILTLVSSGHVTIVNFMFIFSSYLTSGQALAPPSAGCY